MPDIAPEVLEKLLARLKDLDYSGYAEQYPPFASWKKAGPSAAGLRAAWRASLAAAPEAGLFVNVPFCRSKCEFCFLPVIALGPGDAAARKAVAVYLDALSKEAALLAPAFRGTAFTTLYIGGGTPSLLTGGEIDALFSSLRSRFRFSRDVQISTEIHPATASPEILRAFRRNGLNWLCIGAQTLDAFSLARVRRDQPSPSVAQAVRAARAEGIAGINIDLICGLPGQNERAFLADVAAAAALRPEEIHLNAFVVTPYTAFARRGGRQPDRAFVERAREKGFALLAARGYRKLHFDSAGLGPRCQNFQTSDLKARRSVLGLGPGAVSHAWGAARYINLTSWQGYLAALRAGRPPVERHCRCGRQEEMTYYLLESLSNEPWFLSRRKFAAVFGRAPEQAFPGLDERLAAGGVRVTAAGLRASARHWNFLRRALYDPAVFLAARGRSQI